jgi:hypothetical protein
MTVFLIGCAAVTLWVLSLLVHPFGRCWRCGGKGNLRNKRRGRAPKCPRCKGKRRIQRAGSKTVHRVRALVAAHWRPPKAPGGVS